MSAQFSAVALLTTAENIRSNHPSERKHHLFWCQLAKPDMPDGDAFTDRRHFRFPVPRAACVVPRVNLDLLDAHHYEAPTVGPKVGALITVVAPLRGMHTPLVLTGKSDSLVVPMDEFSGSPGISPFEKGKKFGFGPSARLGLLNSRLSPGVRIAIRQREPRFRRADSRRVPL